MTKMEHVPGAPGKKVVLYALSTCGWCKKTKDLLDSLKMSYSYVYADLLEGEDRQVTVDEIKKWNELCSFPTIVIDDKVCIVGYKEDELREALQT